MNLLFQSWILLLKELIIWKKNDKNFKEPILIWNVNDNFAINEKDAIDFYMEIDNKNKSLIILSGIGYMLWEEEKGDIFISQVLYWI